MGECGRRMADKSTRERKNREMMKGEKSRARERRRDNRRKRTGRRGEEKRREKERGEERERRTKIDNWEKTSGIMQGRKKRDKAERRRKGQADKERDGKSDEGEKGGKAGPKRKRKERERERPAPCTCVTVRPRTRRWVLISQRAPRRRASFCEPCFFRHGARRGATGEGAGVVRRS